MALEVLDVRVIKSRGKGGNSFVSLEQTDFRGNPGLAVVIREYLAVSVQLTSVGNVLLAWVGTCHHCFL